MAEWSDVRRACVGLCAVLWPQRKTRRNVHVPADEDCVLMKKNLVTLPWKNRPPPPFRMVMWPADAPQIPFSPHCLFNY